MTHRSSGSAFTLIELLVAMAVGALLLVSLLSVLSGSINVSRKTNDSLLGSNAAAAALDFISTDLESLAVTARTNSEYLRLANEPVQDVADAAKIIMLTSSANDFDNAATDGGQVRAVVYRLGYLDVVSSSGTNKIYGIYRFANTNAGDVFTNYIGKPDLSATTAFTDAVSVTNFLAGNIVDFRVRFYPAGSLTPLNADASKTVSLSATNISVGGTAVSTNPATVEVSLTYLEEAGAKLLKAGALPLDKVKERYGYKLSRKVNLRTPVVSP